MVTVQLAVELTGDSVLNRGSGALRQHDQNIEFARSDIKGALTFRASRGSAAIRRGLCAWTRRGCSSREKSLRRLRMPSAFNVERCRILLDGVEVLGGWPLGRQVGRRRRRDEGPPRLGSVEPLRKSVLRVVEELWAPVVLWSL